MALGIRKKGVSCRLVYPPQGSTEPGLFNDELCVPRYPQHEVHQALTVQRIVVKQTLFSDGSVQLKFRVPSEIFLSTKDLLTARYLKPGCLKRKYTCQDSALVAVRQLITAPNYYNPSGAPLVPYVCPDCQVWHIGHRHKKVWQGTLLPDKNQAC